MMGLYQVAFRNIIIANYESLLGIIPGLQLVLYWKSGRV